MKSAIVPRYGFMRPLGLSMLGLVVSVATMPTPVAAAKTSAAAAQSRQAVGREAKTAANSPTHNANTASLTRTGPTTSSARAPGHDMQHPPATAGLSTLQEAAEARRAETTAVAAYSDAAQTSTNTTAHNPYLAGWFKPVPAAALPAMAAEQLSSNARYVNATVTALPERLADTLPKIKTVHPTGGRDLVVASLKCPAEMMLGHSLAPADLLREGVNGLLGRLNETRLLKFDIQLVCS